MKAVISDFALKFKMAAITAQSVLNVFFMLTIFYLAYEVHYQQVANNEGKNIAYILDGG